MASIISNFVNFGLDLFLMFVLGWGVAGAGKFLGSSRHLAQCSHLAFLVNIHVGQTSVAL